MKAGLPVLTADAVGAPHRRADEDLRRADWRFLLPLPPGGSFDRLVLLGGPGWLADLVVEIGVAREVSRSILPGDSADALVLLDGADVTIAEASKGLSPGGAVYWEVRRKWNSFPNSTPRAIRKSLQEAGLTPLALFWPRPSFSRTAMYLPVTGRSVLSWYVETLVPPRGPWRTGARAFVKLLGWMGVANRWSAFAPRYAVTATAGAMKPAATILGRTDPAGTGGNGELLSAILCGGDRSRRVVIFAFRADARHPSAVMKLWRLPDRNTKTEAEQATLRQIRRHLDDDTGRSVPQPLGTLRWGGILAATESYAPGEPLSHFADAWGRPRRRKMGDLRLVFEWLSRFHRQAQVSRAPWDAAAIETWVEKPVAEYGAAYGIRAEELRLFADLRERARALVGTPLPIVWTHPDLTGANIHRQGRRITVIDWSGATAMPPLLDVLNFVVLWTCRLRRESGLASRLRCLSDLFVGRGDGDRVVSAVRASIVEYMRRVEIDPRFFPVLLVLTWVYRSVGSFDRAQAVARGEPGANPHPEESYVEYVRRLAEAGARLWQPS